MSLNQENSSNSVAPVLLAGSSNLTNWPQSRVLDPIQFQRNKREQSAFQTALLCTSHLPISMAPLVFVAPNQLKTAKKQAEQIGLLSSCQFIVEPIERGNWNAVVFASLMVASSDPNQMMMFMDTVNIPANVSTLAKTYQQIRQNLPENQMVVLGEPYNSAQHHKGSLAQRSGRSVVNSLLQVKPYEDDDTKTATTHGLYSIGSIFMACPNHILEITKSTDSEAFQTIDMALQQSNNMNDASWINLNMWSALEPKHVGRELIKHTDQFLLRPTDILSPKHSETSYSSFSFETENCSVDSKGHLIAIVGCSNLHVTSTRDATLIRSKDTTVDIHTLTNEMREAQCLELFHSPVRHHAWGTETLLEQSHQAQVYKIELHPGASIPEHFHTHRKENWQILSGLGTATISGVTHHITTGWTYSIDKNTIHSCSNSKNHPLVFLETRIGDFLHEDDLVHTQAKNKRFYSAGTKASSPP